MSAPKLRFEDADGSGKTIEVEADPQAAVTPGTRTGTTTITMPDGQQFRIVGDYRDVHNRLQAAAARDHESGDAPQPNTPMG